MEEGNVKVGTRVKITELRSTKGMSIDKSHLNVRKKGIKGIIVSQVPEHWDCVWFVQHDGSKDIGAYVFNEFEQISE